MKRFLPFISVFLFIAVQNVAFAGPDGPGGGHHGKERFEKLDVDKDGKLSRDEVKDSGFLSEKFDEIDTNKDNFLTKEELKAHHDAHRPPQPRADPAE